MISHSSLLKLLCFAFSLPCCLAATKSPRPDVYPKAAKDCVATLQIAPRSRLHQLNQWIPACEHNGSYKSIQRDVTGQQFCLTPNGRLAYVPNKSLPANGTLSCDCPVQFYQILTQKRKFGTFAPFCERDGTFKPVQCHPGTRAKPVGICYCVDPTGKYLGEKPYKYPDTYCTTDLNKFVIKLPVV